MSIGFDTVPSLDRRTDRENW